MVRSSFTSGGGGSDDSNDSTSFDSELRELQRGIIETGGVGGVASPTSGTSDTDTTEDTEADSGQSDDFEESTDTPDRGDSPLNVSTGSSSNQTGVTSGGSSSSDDNQPEPTNPSLDTGDSSQDTGRTAGDSAETGTTPTPEPDQTTTQDTQETTEPQNSIANQSPPTTPDFESDTSDTTETTDTTDTSGESPTAPDTSTDSQPAQTQQQSDEPQTRQEQIESFIRETEGIDSRDDVTVDDGTIRLSEQGRRERGAFQLNQDVAAATVTAEDVVTTTRDGQQVLTLSDDTRQLVQQRTARGAVGGTTNSQRTLVELNDPAIRARGAIGGTTEAQREFVTDIGNVSKAEQAAAIIEDETGESIDPENVQDPERIINTLGDGDTDSLDTTEARDAPDGIVTPTTNTQTTDAPSVSQQQDIEQDSVQNAIDAITGTSAAGADYLRQNVIAPTGDVTGDVADFAQANVQLGTSFVTDESPQEAQDRVETTAGDILRGEQQEEGDTTAIESGTDALTRGTLDVAPQIVEGPQTVSQLVNTGVEAGEFAATNPVDESAQAASDTVVATAEGAIQSARENPAFTAGTFLGTALRVS